MPFDRELAKQRLADMQRLKDVAVPKARRYIGLPRNAGQTERH